MAKRIEWSDKAIDRLSEAIKFLKLEVSHSAAVNFAELIDKRVAFIENTRQLVEKSLTAKRFDLF